VSIRSWPITGNIAPRTWLANERGFALFLDLFYELAVPPALGRTEAAVLAESMAEIELADRLGFHGVWLVEHHFMPGYSHSSKPDLVLAALSQRTSRLRLGFGVVPLPYHHPVHVAERVATLDLLCGGRLELGIGRGFSPREYAAFGVAMAESRNLVEESLAILRAAAHDAPVTFTGRHFKLDGVTIVPRPVQRPYPPLWSAAVSPDTFEWAAREGLGVLAGPFKPWLMVAADIRRYRAAWRRPEPPRIGMTVGMLCLRDGRRARALAAPAMRWFYDELLRVTAPVLESLLPSYEQFHDLGRFRRLLRFGARPRILDLAGLSVVGTPADCIARLDRYRKAGVTHLLCAIGAGALPTEIVRESLECIAAEVLPALVKGTGA
jgi:alkanesulfonate monooxygenase SsuD/methylene tetrahydromethanopterin reductase-like flavin-dependent oxidoreductase (luciferase family)